MQKAKYATLCDACSGPPWQHSSSDCSPKQLLPVSFHRVTSTNIRSSLGGSSSSNIIRRLQAIKSPKYLSRNKREKTQLLTLAQLSRVNASHCCRRSRILLALNTIKAKRLVLVTKIKSISQKKLLLLATTTTTKMRMIKKKR